MGPGPYLRSGARKSYALRVRINTIRSGKESDAISSEGIVLTGCFSVNRGTASVGQGNPSADGHNQTRRVFLLP